jgi:hypothetical protein
VKNRQNPALKKKELYYGEKRPFNLDTPPEDPGSNFLSRVKTTCTLPADPNSLHSP